MNAETVREGGARPEGLLRIEGEMTIYQAAELKQTMLASLEQGDALELDLSAVTEIDSSGVQLLVAARKTAEARNKRLRLVRPSAAVTEVFALFGLDGDFDAATVSEAR